MGAPAAWVADTVQEIAKPVVNIVQEVAKPVVNIVQEVAKPVVNLVEDTAKNVSTVVGDAVKDVGNVLADIDDNIIQPAAKIVNTTIDNALKDPVGTIAKVTAAVYAPYLLPYVNAAHVLANGGSMDDALQAGALTFVAQEAFSSLELGTETLPDGFVGPPQAITAKSLTSDLGNWVAENSAALGETGQNILTNSAVQGTLNSVKGGLMAVFEGRDIGDGMTEGFVSGSLSGGLGAGFSETAKELGFDTSNKTTAMAGKTIIALAQGADPNVMLANYLAYTVNSAGAEAIAKTTKDTYETFTSYSKEFNEKNSKYEDGLTTYKSDRQKYVDQNEELQKDIIEKWNPVQSKLNEIIAEQSNLKEDFDNQKSIYDDASKSVDERNAAADKMETIADDYKKKDAEYTTMYESNKGFYADLVNRRDALSTGIENLDSTTGKALEEARTELENDVKTLQEYKSQYESASENYDRTIAEATTKNVLIDSINSGVVTGERQEDGSILLSNGMSVKDGQFYQEDGKNAFANGDQIEQGQIRFTDQNGKEVWYSNDRTKQVSVTDAQDMLFDQFGVKVDRADVLDIVGEKFGDVDENLIRSVATNKVNEQYNSLLGRDATQEEIDGAFAPGSDALQTLAGKLADEILPTDQFFGSQEEKVAFAKQLAAVREDKGVGAEFTYYNPFTNDWETYQAFTDEDAQNQETKGGVEVDENAFTSQWQRVGDNRVFIHDDGSASVINPETGETDGLDQFQVKELIDQGLLNSWDSGYYDAIGISGLSEEDFINQEDGGVGPSNRDYERAADKYMDEYGNFSNKRLGSPAGVINQLSRPDRTGMRSGMGGTNVVRGVLPGQTGSGTSGVQVGAAQKGVLPAGNPLEQDYLNIGLSKEKFIDPLSQLYQIQQATQQGGDANLAQMMFQQFNPMAPQATQPTQASGTGDSYYNYGDADDTYTGAIDPYTTNPYTPSPYAQGFESSTMAASGGAIMATPLMAHGGKTLPLNVNGVLPTVNQGREDFKNGKHVAGEGDGQSDDIPAWLADGEFVFPADVVSALGNGSTKAGTDKLYDMMHSIREQARSSKPKDLPPPAKKSPLDYLKA